MDCSTKDDIPTHTWVVYKRFGTCYMASDWYRFRPADASVGVRRPPRAVYTLVLCCGFDTVGAEIGRRRRVYRRLPTSRRWQYRRDFLEWILTWRSVIIPQVVCVGLLVKHVNQISQPEVPLMPSNDWSYQYGKTNPSRDSLCAISYQISIVIHKNITLEKQ